MASEYRQRVISSIKEIIPSTLKTCIWIIKITVGVSFGILLLRYFNILPWISSVLSPLFVYFGLPGEASLAYVTGYFVNVYSAIAVAVTLNLDVRAVTILSVMVLCSHNIILETAVQKKTGTSALRIVITRTLSALILGFVLNLLIPVGKNVAPVALQVVDNDFLTMFLEWLKSTGLLVLKMTVLIFTLNIAQRLLANFGIIKWLSNFLRPLLKVFGLPAKASFLWIIANIIGLAYGAAAMIDEIKAGKLSKEDINMTNIHISISHSNFEDLILLSSIGAVWWIMLLSRWMMSILLVWGYKLELVIKNKFLPLQDNISRNGTRED
jgi:spore maturation protein SpmB